MNSRDVHARSDELEGGQADADLIRDIIRRPELGALEALYNRHSVLAFSLAVRMLEDRQAAEDVVQEAFLTVWRNASRFDTDRGSFRSWLVTIVRSRCLDRLRAKSVRPQLTALEGVPEAADPHDVWHEVYQTLTGEDVREALEQLPLDQRQTIELAYFGGLSQSEIASRTGIPLGTVKSRIRIGLQRLRGLLGPRELDTVS